MRQFCEVAFGHLELNYHDYVKVDPLYMRPTDIAVLQGNPAKAKKYLNGRALSSSKNLLLKWLNLIWRSLNILRDSKYTYYNSSMVNWCPIHFRTIVIQVRAAGPILVPHGLLETLR